MVYLRKLQKLRVLKYDVDFADINIKGKTTGNIVSKNPIKNIELKSKVSLHCLQEKYGLTILLTG